MKIAILSDIHGNAVALEAVISDIRTKECPLVLCLGDIVVGGYLPNKTISMLEALPREGMSDLRFIAGETDLYLKQYLTKTFFKTRGIPNKYKQFVKNDAALLTPSDVDFVLTLPKKLEITVGNFRIFACHGSPNSITEGIDFRTPINAIENLVKKIDADLIVCGHSHVANIFYLPSGKTVLNAGSVGMPQGDDKRAVYALLDLQNAEGDYTLEFQYVNYDVELAAEYMRKRGFSAAILNAKKLLGEE